MSDTPSEPERKCNTNVLSHPHAILCLHFAQRESFDSSLAPSLHLFVLTPCPSPTSALTACYSMIPPGLALYPIPMISAFPLFSSLFFILFTIPNRPINELSVHWIGNLSFSSPLSVSRFRALWASSGNIGGSAGAEVGIVVAPSSWGLVTERVDKAIVFCVLY